MDPVTPHVGSRWVHRKCKRIAMVMGCRAVPIVADGSTLLLIEYRYEQTAAVVGYKRRGRSPTQEITLAQWTELFTEPAIQKEPDA